MPACVEQSRIVAQMQSRDPSRSESERHKEARRNAEHALFRAVASSFLRKQFKAKHKQGRSLLSRFPPSLGSVEVKVEAADHLTSPKNDTIEFFFLFFFLIKNIPRLKTVCSWQNHVQKSAVNCMQQALRY